MYNSIKAIVNNQIMDKEICTIWIGKGALDDDYTFYKSGKIKRVYDQSTYKPNMEEWIDAQKIDDNKKRKLLENCAEEHREQVKLILYPR